MADLVKLVGPNHAVELLGVKLVGMNAENGRKLLFTFAFIAFVMLLHWALKWVSARLLWRTNQRVAFWARQGVRVFASLLMVLGLVSIWFDDPTRLTTALGLITAGLAFALQKVVTAFAGYLVILRGKNFDVGDRIVMGGVRGDVIGLSFLQTAIMEMGQPADVEEGTKPAMWIRSRQYTGRIVTVTNDKIFSEPVYNFTRDFPYFWEEMRVPISYQTDRQRTEEILLAAAERSTVKLSEISAEHLNELKRRYFMQTGDVRPRVYLRMTDNWLELAVRFIVPDRGAREIKDAMTREILEAFDEAGISIASMTVDIVGMPSLTIARKTGS